jgi:hypothetical protein
MQRAVSRLRSLYRRVHYEPPGSKHCIRSGALALEALPGSASLGQH